MADRPGSLDPVHIRLLTYQFGTFKPPWWRLQNIQSTFWRLYMNNQDGAFLEQAGSAYPLLKGRLYFVPAGVRFATNLTQEVGHFWVHFDLIGLSRILTRTIFAQVICLPALPTLENRVGDLIQELEQHTGVALLQQIRVKAILYEGLDYYLQSMPVEQLQHMLSLTTSMEPVLPALEQIETQIAMPLLIADLASRCHMNSDYFIRRFRACVGQTPVQYIQEQRVKRAEQQLLLTDQSIEQIAANTGFGNRYYFTRIFARLTGVSPAAYRKGQRGL